MATPFDKVSPGADNVCLSFGCTLSCSPSCDDAEAPDISALRGDNKLFDPSGGKDVSGGVSVCRTTEFIFRCCAAS